MSQNGKGNEPNKGRNLIKHREGYDNIDWSDKRTSVEWCDNQKIVIIDPDGWDKKKYEYSFKQEKITKEEFYKKVNLSTNIVKVNENRTIKSPHKSIN